jgi:hypothetical protein
MFGSKDVAKIGLRKCAPAWKSSGCVLMVAFVALATAGCGTQNDSDGAPVSLGQIQNCLRNAGIRATAVKQSYSTSLSSGKVPSGTVPAILIGPSDTPTAVVVALRDVGGSKAKIARQSFLLLGGEQLAPNVVLVPWIPDATSLTPVGHGFRTAPNRPSVNEIPSVDQIKQCGSGA